ncbi:MAG: NAD(+) synthase [Pseudomonadota bacterium]
MKVCLGQINTTPGDFAGNLAAIFEGIDVASRAVCDVVVFPELCIPGYLGQDLLYHPAYVDANLKALAQVREYTRSCFPGLHVVVGYINRNPAPGKPFLNSAAVLRHGEVVGIYSKQLIPFYDVFDELRYFEPGTDLLMVEIAGVPTGIAICEDLWNDKGSDDYSYSENPMQQYREAGARVLLSLNSSPYVHDKAWQRISVISPGTKADLTVVYVNQWGGQDELVFDGHSFVVRGGDLLHLTADVTRNRYDVVDIEKTPPCVPQLDRPGAKAEVLLPTVPLYDLVVLGLRDYAGKSGFGELVLASSGGVDSAVVCQIACDAVGADKVHAIRMPSVYSSDHSRTDAMLLHQNLGCWDYEVPVEHHEILDSLAAAYGKFSDVDLNLVTRVMRQERYASVADENIQARLRDVFLMHFSNAYGAMPLSTGNKTESACGYYTHFDMNFSYAPIKDLYKYQVFDFARQSPAVPQNIWQKPPSAELAHGQTDEQSLLPYPVLDPVVRAYVEDYISDLVTFSGWVDERLGAAERISGDTAVLLSWLVQETAPRDFSRIISLMGRMEYKRRQTCPGTKVSKVAFGIGRRIPIVEKWS